MPCHFLVHDGNYMGQSRRDYTRLAVSLLLIVDVISRYYAINAVDKRVGGFTGFWNPDILEILKHSFYDVNREAGDTTWTLFPLESLFMQKLCRRIYTIQNVVVKDKGRYIFILYKDMPEYSFESTNKRTNSTARESFRRHSFALYLSLRYSIS